MDSTERKEERKMKGNKKMNRKANSLMEIFLHGNILVFFVFF